MPAAPTSITTSPAAGIGSGTSRTSRTSGPPGRVMTTARTSTTVAPAHPERTRCRTSRPRVAAMDHIAVGIGPLTEADVVAVARYGAGVRITDDAMTAIASTRS